MAHDLDMALLAREFLTELRGSRSQVQWSRRLGYRSNVAYPWESGRRFPNAAEALRAVRRSGRDLEAGITRFYGRPPPWLSQIDPASEEGVTLLLNDLKGTRSVSAIARSAALNRHAVSRWMLGRTQPRLPDFFRIISATSVRLPDFVAAFVEPTRLPSLAETWKRIEARREGASRFPWTQAVLRALELQECPAPYVDGWLSSRLGIAIEEEQRCLEFLQTTGQVRQVRGQYVVEAMAVDTRRRPEVGRRVKAHWSEVAAARILEGSPGQFSYNVFAVSDEDFEAIRALHLAYFHALRSLVAESTPGERVAVANVQLFALDPP